MHDKRCRAYRNVLAATKKTSSGRKPGGYSRATWKEEQWYCGPFKLFATQGAAVRGNNTCRRDRRRNVAGPATRGHGQLSRSYPDAGCTHKQSCCTDSPPVGLRAVLPRDEQQRYEKEGCQYGPHLPAEFSMAGSWLSWVASQLERRKEKKGREGWSLSGRPQPRILTSVDIDRGFASAALDPEADRSRIERRP